MSLGAAAHPDHVVAALRTDCYPRS